MKLRIRDRVGRIRWFGAVFLATLGAALAVLFRPGVYSSDFDVVLVAATPNVNVLDGSSDGLTYLAGITAKSVTGDLGDAATVSDEVSLAARGKFGWTVTQPNEGGQWTYWFPRSVLDVEIAGRDEQEVRREIDEVVGRIRTDIDRRERAAGVTDGNRVRLLVVPTAPEVSYNVGDRSRALVAALALALVLGAAAHFLVRRFGTVRLTQFMLSRRRRTSKDPHGTSIGTGEEAPVSHGVAGSVPLAPTRKIVGPPEADGTP